MGKGRSVIRLERWIPHKTPKKGDLSNCSNYRGITILSVPGKVFNIIIIGKSLEWNSPLYINFVDYEKAFDSINTMETAKTLRDTYQADQLD